MNGTTAEPSVRNMNMPSRTSMMMIGASHHLLVSFRNRNNSLKTLNRVMVNHYTTVWHHSATASFLEYPQFFIE